MKKKIDQGEGKKNQVLEINGSSKSTSAILFDGREGRE